MLKVLLTTTSFQDTPGGHRELLEAAGFDVQRERGPLSEARMLELAGGFDAFLCGDDAITAAVIDQSLPRLRVISKYGIGVDKIDVAHASEKGVPVLFTPGVNHTTVAEHAFGLMLCLSKGLPEAAAAARAGEWKRETGRELLGKTIGILGLGRIGKEVAVRARAFGMPVVGYDPYWDESFAEAHGVGRLASAREVFEAADVVSLHLFLTGETRDMVDEAMIARMRPGALLINCARGELVDSRAVASALESGVLGGYGADVLEVEPPPPDHPLLRAPRCVITPHIGSRTYESVVRQGTKSVENLILALAGRKPRAQVNQVPVRASDEAARLAGAFPWVAEAEAAGES
ncbi:MAG: phosphoglycerate dehydrogenase [Puniceicoccaceae bacterium]